MDTTPADANSLMREGYPVLQLLQPLREQLMDVLTDDDLAFALPGNPSLGDVCRTMGSVQAGYIDSFRTFRMSEEPPGSPPATAHTVAGLAAWYRALDDELASVLAALSEADIQERMIERPTFSVPPAINLHVYREALLIFYGKVSVYLNAIGTPPPPQWATWIG